MNKKSKKTEPEKLKYNEYYIYGTDYAQIKKGEIFVVPLLSKTTVGMGRHRKVRIELVK